MIGPEFDSVLGAAQAGAEWAFTAIYRDLHPRILRFLRTQAPGDAEDIAAETWLGIARNLAGFAGSEAAFRAWVFTIARRHVIGHWRAAGRRPVGPAPSALFAGIPGPDDPEASAMATMSAQDAADAISRALPPAQAEVILLRVLGGLDTDQVAAVIGKRPGAVRVLQHRALRTLAGKLSTASVTL